MFVKRNILISFAVILILLTIAIFFALPKEPQLNIFGWSPSDMEVQLGLDLQGGSHLVFEADLKDISSDSLASAKESLITISSGSMPRSRFKHSIASSHLFCI